MNNVIDMSAISDRRELMQAPASETAALMQGIVMAARDPATDINKMERLMAMHERIVARNAESQFNEAMTGAQADMGPISADAVNPQTHSKYATYAKLDRRLRPIYTKHGFALSFDEGVTTKPEYVRVLCYVSHNAGHTRTYTRDMPADGKGAKGGDVMTKTHAAGAAMSYGMRYLLKGIFNVAVGEDDNDGNGEPVSNEQIAALEALLKKVGANKINFLGWARVNSLAEILACNFDACVEAIESKAKQVDPRGDLSGVDMPLRDKHVNSLTDILNSDKEEADIAGMLREYIAEELQPFPELYITVLDKLSADKIISKANFRKYLELGGRGK